MVSLLCYAEIASPEAQHKVRETMKKSLAFQLAIDQEVNNPFGYARQLTQDKDGNRRTTSFSRTIPKSRHGGRGKRSPVFTCRGCPAGGETISR